MCVWFVLPWCHPATCAGLAAYGQPNNLLDCVCTAVLLNLTQQQASALGWAAFGMLQQQ
jgi:hypothetical protein